MLSIGCIQIYTGEEQAQLFPNAALALLLPPSVEVFDDLPSEVIELVHQFWDGELDSYKLMPLMVNLRKQMEKVKLARLGV